MATKLQSIGAQVAEAKAAYRLVEAPAQERRRAARYDAEMAYKEALRKIDDVYETEIAEARQERHRKFWAAYH